MSSERWVIPDIYGGLGNRLFEFAAAAGAAELWGRQVCFNTEFFEDNDHDDPLTICELFPRVARENTVQDIHKIEYSHDDVYIYRPLPPSPPSAKHIVLTGLFQSPLYFPKDGIRPNWENALGTAGLATIEARAGLEDPKERRRTWFVHFRFGDFLKSAFYYWDLSHYYKTCLERVPKGARLHAFSDEPERVRTWLEAVATELGLEVTWSQALRDAEGLYEMSLCWAGAICANSTYSWWGAYFAHEAALIGGSKHRAYYPDGWGLGLPRPTDLVPTWGEMIATEWGLNQDGV
jgi:hypothetical protein